MSGAGSVARVGDRRVAESVTLGITRKKRRLASPRHKWEDNINGDLQDVGWGGKDWVELAQDTDKRQALANV
jgi:hypothetical protein